MKCQAQVRGSAPLKLIAERRRIGSDEPSINLDVVDLDKAVHFYSSVFGLRIGRSFGAFGVEMIGSSAQSICWLRLLVRGRRPQPHSVVATNVIGRRSISILS